MRHGRDRQMTANLTWFGNTADRRNFGSDIFPQHDDGLRFWGESVPCVPHRSLLFVDGAGARRPLPAYRVANMRVDRHLGKSEIQVSVAVDLAGGALEI